MKSKFISNIMLFLFCAFISSTPLLYAQSEPNPPTWPDSIKVFDSNDPGAAQTIVDQIFSENGGQTPPNHGQWSNSRYALLFKPGHHAINVKVGYYTSLIGLGATPDKTTIQNVTCEDGGTAVTVGALSNFWRSIENFSVTPSTTWNNQKEPSMLWAVSQAAPMRRVIVNGNLNLWEYIPPYQAAGYSSGGFMADCQITGICFSGSQQQWITRNSDLEKPWDGGNWNMVFVGTKGAPPSHCGHEGTPPYTTVDQTPVIAEKPYIILNKDGSTYSLMIPPLETGKVGASSDYTQGQPVDFTKVYVAKETDSADTINEKLKNGLHVILTPGNYNLTESIQINNDDLCLLGLGFPTLISTQGKPCIVVGDNDGVKIAGVLLQAGSLDTPTLLQWGQGHAGDPKNPGFLYDCFARVGGTNDPTKVQMKADTMVQINNGYVVGDNFWLWRADHDITGKVYNGDNPCDNGIIVNGDNVTIYGLAVEHTLQDLTQWNGENGQVYFYQSEFPYDVTDDYATKGYVSYRVGADRPVTSHKAWGVGAYSYFRDHDVTVESGISCPSSGSVFVNSLSVFLNGNGGITHVINDKGNPVNSSLPQDKRQAYVCSYSLSDSFLQEGNEPEDESYVIETKSYFFGKRLIKTRNAK